MSEVKAPFEIYPEVKGDRLKFKGSYADYDIQIRNDGFNATDLREGGFGHHFYSEPIRYFGFDDIPQISVLTKVPYHVQDIVKYDGSSEFQISSEQLLANDKDYRGAKLHVSNVEGAIGGDVSISKDGNITFKVDAKYDGVKSFKYHVKNEFGYENDRGIPVYLRESDHPNDPHFYNQWYLFDIDAMGAWKDYTGKGISVAVYDFGFQPNHPDLEINSHPWHVEQGCNYLSQHALMVAGVIGAKADNGIGLTGIAHGANITSLQFPFCEQEKATLEFAKNYDVINNSWGSAAIVLDTNLYSLRNDQRVEQIEEAIRFGRDGKGSIIVFSSGNSHLKGLDTNFQYDRVNPYVVNAGGYTKPAKKLDYETNYLEFTTQASTVLVSAPASNFPVLYARDILFDGNSLSLSQDSLSVAGTSFSAPTVSGVAALMLEANPDLGWRDVQDILTYSADSFTYAVGATMLFNKAANSNGGNLLYNKQYGFGVVNAHGAVRLAETWEAKNTFENYYHSFSESLKLVQPINFKDENGKLKALGHQIATSTEVNIQLEYVQVDLEVTFPKSLENYEINLVSPSCLQTKDDGSKEMVCSYNLMKNPGRSPIFDNQATEILSKDKYLKWTFGLQHARGEFSKGDWILLIKEHEEKLTLKDDIQKILKENLSGNKPDIGVLNGFNIRFFGKTEEYFMKEMIYTPVFANDIVYNDERKTIKAGEKILDTINTVAVKSDAVIDLTSSQSSKIADKEVILEKGHNMVNVKTGDGNDIIIGDDRDNIIMPGRGDNEITLNGGNDTVWFPNLDWSDMRQNTIHDFNTVTDKLRIGGDWDYEKLSQCFQESKKTATVTIDVDGVEDKASETTYTTTISCEESDWSIVLEKVELASLAENNFEFV